MVARGLGVWGLLLVAVTLLLAGPAAADGGRLALVIGNSAYADGALANPANDATDFAAKLRTLGFTADLLLNADQRTMEQAIETFTRSLAGAGKVGLFYYAGHGIEYQGRNYLIPVGSKIGGEVDLRYAAVDAGRVLDGMAESGNGLNMVVLDACRNNPYRSSFRSLSRGLARLTPTKGTLILYATQPGAVAGDGGSGRNGIFTKHLLAALDEPGLEVEQVFKRAAQGVDRETGGAQTPWVEGVVLGQFAFLSAGGEPVPAAAAPAPAAAAPAPVVVVPDQSQFELEFWNSVKNSDDPADFQAYLTKYPQGQFNELARRRAARLTEAARSLPTVRPPSPGPSPSPPPAPPPARSAAPPAIIATAHVCRLDPNGDNFLSLRTGPRSSASEILRLSANTPLVVLETRGSWLRVRLRDGTLGWVYGQWVCRHGH